MKDRRDVFLIFAVFVLSFSVAEAVTRVVTGSGDCIGACPMNAKTSSTGIDCGLSWQNCTSGSCLPRQNVIGSTKYRWCGCSNDAIICCTARDSWISVGSDPPHWELDNVYCATTGGVSCDPGEGCFASIDYTCDCQ